MKDLENVKLFLMDMDGTVYVGDEPIAGAMEALEELKKRGKKVLFLTNNSSQTASAYVEKLKKMGYAATENDIYSSGEATIDFLLNERKGKKVFLLANSAVYKQFEEAGVPLAEEGVDLVVLCFDPELTYRKLVIACNYLQEGKEFIASHPDFNCPANPYPVPDVGSFLALIKGTTGRSPDLIVGKPYSVMAENVGRRFGLKAEEIAMVGDRLYTDIMFAINNGMKSVLVLTGETSREMLDASDVRPDVVLETFSDVLSRV